VEPLYSIVGHAMLGVDARTLDEATLDAYTLVSEAALGLNGTSLTGTDAEQAALANVLQVNAMLELPADAWYASQSVRGQRSVTYRGKGDLLVDGRAKAIVSTLIVEDAAAGWAQFKPRR
jgi:hypothetical protein